MTSPRRGVTLVELLVTIAITGLMISSGAYAFNQIIDSRRIVVDANESAERGAALREMLHAWLYSGVVTMTPIGQTPTGTGSATNQTYATNGMPQVNPAVVTGDVLNFTTTALTPLNSDSTTMRLFIDDDENTPEHGLTLEYRANAMSPWMRVQLDTTITLMVAEYRDTQTNLWLTTDQVTGITPKGLRVTFFSSDSFNTSGIVSLPIIVPMGANATAAPGQTTAPVVGGGL